MARHFMARRPIERGRCAACKRVVAVKAPPGGDGSEVRPVRHKPPIEAVGVPLELDGFCGGHYVAAVDL